MQRNFSSNRNRKKVMSQKMNKSFKHFLLFSFFSSFFYLWGYMFIPISRFIHKNNNLCKNIHCSLYLRIPFSVFSRFFSPVLSIYISYFLFVVPIKLYKSKTRKELAGIVGSLHYMFITILSINTVASHSRENKNSHMLCTIAQSIFERYSYHPVW